MNILDYIILIPLLYFTVKGVLRGFIREILSLAGIILGTMLGIAFIPDVTKVLSHYLPNSRILPLVSFVLIFILVLIICNLLGWGLRFLLKKVFLGWFDRLMGGIFAVIKTVILAYIGIILLTFYVPAKAPLIAESVLAPWIIKSYQSIISLVSPDHYKNLKRKVLGEAGKINNIIFEKGKNDTPDKK